MEENQINDAEVSDTEEIAKKINEIQRENLRRKIQNLEEHKPKGNTSAIFKLKELVVGKKKIPQESISILDLSSKTLVFDHDQIKNFLLNYCTTLFTNNNPEEDYEAFSKLKEELHEARMEENIENDVSLDKKDFDDVLAKLGGKHKQKYKFVLNSGTVYRNKLFELFQSIWSAETKPEKRILTTLVQTFKGGRGSP